MKSSAVFVIGVVTGVIVTSVVLLVSRSPKAAPSAAKISTSNQLAAHPGDAAIMDYLGEPVPAPASLDPMYSAKELAAAFQNVCDTLGIKVEKLTVDTTEFPFILQGLVDKETGVDFFRRIDSELQGLQGYSYGGSVTGRASRNSIYFALNMTPASAYPPDHAEAIRRRLMVRLQMLTAAWTNPER